MPENFKFSKRSLERSSPNDLWIPVYEVLPSQQLSLADMDNNKNYAIIGVPELHEIGLMGDNEVIGIIDSGARPDQYKSSRNFVKEEDLEDRNGHGTHVTSIIKNIIPVSEIHVAKAMNRGGGGRAVDVVQAIYWLIESGCMTINGSFAFNTAPIPEFDEAIQYGVDRGVLFCFASGNEGASNVSFPGAKDNVFGVGAVDNNLNLAHFSNTGSALDLVAPGVRIMGEMPDFSKAAMSGTSQACPHVAGMLALYRQYRAREGVVVDFYVAYDRISKMSVKDLGNAGMDNSFGHGLIQPYFAGVYPGKQSGSGPFAWLWRFFDKLFS